VADALAAASPSTVAFFRSAFPAFDLTTPGGLLDLVFVGFGFIFGGFAAATLVSGWGSDEARGRLEVVLSTPLSRARWAAAGGLGVYGAIAAMTVVVSIAIGLGASLVGGDIVTPMIGAAALGLYAAAVAGIGIAVGGIFRSGIAGEVAAAFVIVTFLLDLIVPVLGLPSWVHGLALSSHFGHPMTGGWDPVGVVACLAIAVGGLGLGAWGMQRRDVSV
jgi:ABC-2 type transport system permease protein